MRRHLFAVVILLGLASPVATSCASAPSIPVMGSASDRSSLTGEWLGTYVSPDLGRQGAIWFRLAAGAAAAQGDVLMTPRGSRKPYSSYQPPDFHNFEPSRFLAIRFVRVSDDLVTGELESYWDPDCPCFAATHFEGRLDGNLLGGRLMTRLGNGVVAIGSWRVVRQPVK